MNGVDVHAHPDRFFIAARLAAQRRAPKARRELPLRHLARLSLRCRAARAVPAPEGARARRALPELPRDARDPRRGRRDRLGEHPGGRDASRPTCSSTAAASRACLIEKALHTPFVSFSSNLFNDAAVALPTPIEARSPRETVSTALQARLGLEDPAHQPLRQRLRVQQPVLLRRTQAETELRAHLGLLDVGRAGAAPEDEDRPGHASTGTRTASRSGSSQGFIEPLEATALLFIQQTASDLRRVPGAGRSGEAAHESFNERVNAHFEGIARLHRHALQDQHPQGHRVLARERRQHEPLGRAEEAATRVDGRPEHRRRRRPAGASARAIRSSPGMRSWPAWASFPSASGPARAQLHAEARYQHGRDRQSARAQRRQLPRSRRRARPHRAAAHRAVAADLLLVVTRSRARPCTPTPVTDPRVADAGRGGAAHPQRSARRGQPCVLRGLARDWPAVARRAVLVAGARATTCAASTTASRSTPS